MGIHSFSSRDRLEQIFAELQARLRYVRIVCGDWKRVLGRSPTTENGLTGVFLDPPYSDRRDKVYAKDSRSVYAEVREWCLANGDNPKLRIALCGLRGEHDILEKHGWVAYAWTRNAGYGNQGKGRGRANAKEEVIWFSPHCLNPHLVMARSMSERM